MESKNETSLLSCDINFISDKSTLFVTNLDKYGPYLRFSGYRNPEDLHQITSKLKAVVANSLPIDSSWHLSRQEELFRPDKLFIYKKMVDKTATEVDIKRVRIKSTKINNNKLEIEADFIDYGYTSNVFSNDLVMPNYPEALQNIPSTCVHYIMLGICLDWTKSQLQELTAMVKHQTIDIHVSAEYKDVKFITIKWKGFELPQYLIHHKKMGAPIVNELLFENFKKIYNEIPFFNSKITVQNENSSCNNNNYIANNNNVYNVGKIKVAKTNNTNPNMLDYSTHHQYQHHGFSARSPYPPVPMQLYMKAAINKRNEIVYGRQQWMQPMRFYYPNFQISNSERYPPPEPIRDVYEVQISDNTHMNYQRRNNSHLKRDVAQIISAATNKPLHTKQSAFTCTNLLVGTSYNVSVSFVENGPCLFCVQLAENEANLTNMMNQIESINHRRLSVEPTLGTTCIARYAEDGQFYRALVIGVQKFGYKVSYIDYGNSALVNINDMYEIPDIFLQHEPYAMKFSLSSIHDLEPIDESLKKSFKDLVLYKNCALTVMPVEGPPLIQFCDLYIDGKSVFKILKQIQQSRLVYPPAENLEHKEMVEIRYIESPKNFYVQKISNIKKFEKLMDEMFVYYNTNQKIPIPLILGAPCIVKYENEWYRAEIMRIDEKVIVVRHVDFGYEQTVQINLLSTIAEEHLKLPRQAVQCCLKGFEKTELIKENLITQFEMLAEETNRHRRSFTVHVFRIEPSGVNMVNLTSKELNVMKKLYKLNIPFERYLTFEKEGLLPKTNKQINQKNYNVSSVASSSDIHSSISSDKKGHVLSSTALLSEKQIQEEEYEQKQLGHPKQNKVNIHQRKNLKNSNISDCEKYSNSSSNDNRSKNNSQHSKNHNNVNEFSNEIRNKKTQLDLNNKAHEHNGFIKDEKHRAKTQATGRSPNSSQSSSQSKKHAKQTSPSDYCIEQKRVEEFMSLDFSFPTENINIPMEAEVIISWWVSPHLFYVQFKSTIEKFNKLLTDMIGFYKNMPIHSLRWKSGNSVIVRGRKDNLFHRARIISATPMLRRYKVFCVDTGNIISVGPDDIFKVEKRYSDIPCIAHECALQNIFTISDKYIILQEVKNMLTKNPKVMCSFIKHKQGKNVVNIKVNNVSLRNSLKDKDFIIDNPDLAINLLKSQQIRVKICQVNSLSSFKIQLDHTDPQIQVTCSYFDTKYMNSNRTLDDKFREFYKSKTCVVEVVNVDDHNVCFLRPLVPLFKPDIQTYICTYPIVKKYYDARVVHINSLNRLHVHCVEHEREIKKMSAELFEAYEEKGELLSNFGVDQICAAKSSNGNWCRARIVSTLKKTVELFFIDYGYTEIRERNSVKKLDKQFYVNKSSYGIEINLPVKLSETISDAKKNECLIKMQDILLNKIISFEPIEIRKNRLIAQLILEEKSVIEILKSLQLIEAESLEYVQNLINKEKSNKFIYIETVDLTQDESDTDGASSEKKTVQSVREPEAIKMTKNINLTKGCDTITRTLFNPVEDVVPNEPLYIPNKVLYTIKQDSISKKPEINIKPKNNPYENMEQGQLAHCDNPTQFYIHPKCNLETLRNLQENLQIISASLPPLMRIMDGANCISFYSVNKQYYRAKIIDSELMVIKFIDYGNSDCVTDTTDVKEMSVFPDMDPLCIPCALPIKPKGTTDWVDAANSIFNDSYNKLIYYKFLTHGGEKNSRYIDLYIDDVNVAEKLIEVGYAVPLVVVTSKELCYISHINNISDFYIQYAKDRKTLELIEMFLADYTALLEVETFERDKIVAALFPEDGMWYRAKLLEETADKSYKVLFIDYGNTCITPQCRIVSDTVSKVPSLSIKCSLLSDNSFICSEATEQKFADLITIGQNEFTIELIEPAVDHAKVNLFAGDRNIKEELEIFDKQNNLSGLESNAALSTRRVSRECVTLADPTNSDIGETNVHKNTECYPQPYATPKISNDLEPSNCLLNPISMAGTVSHINSIYSFYVQTNENFLRVKEMSENLKLLARDSMQVLEIGELCAAYYDKNNTLRRARILEILPNSEYRARVQFIDYGNCAESSDIRNLPQRFKQFQELCMHCKLNNADLLQNVNNSADKMFKNLTKACNRNVKIEFSNADDRPIAVQIYSAETDDNLNSQLEGILNKSQKFIEQTAKPIDAEQKVVRTITKAESTCHITHVESATSFYIQLASSASYLELITARLEKSIADKYDLVTVLENGKICCAFIAEDDLYYRVKIASISSENIRIFLIDYGYHMTVTQLRELPSEIVVIPPLALHCTLNVLPEAPTKQIDKCFHSLVEQHFGDFFQIGANKKDETTGKHVVKLQTNYKDLADELAELVSYSDENMKAVSTMPVLHECIVIFVNSINSFYIQLKKDIPAIQRITEKLAFAEKEFKLITELKVGMICAALFPGDLSYYRAKIVKVLENGKCEVHYLDFGNNAECETCYALPESLIEEQRYSKHCSLDEDFTARDEVSTEFQNFVTSNFSQTFQVEFLKTTEDPYICRMFFQKKILAAELLKLINNERNNENIGPKVADTATIRPNV